MKKTSKPEAQTGLGLLGFDLAFFFDTKLSHDSPARSPFFGRTSLGKQEKVYKARFFNFLSWIQAREVIVFLSITLAGVEDPFFCLLSQLHTPLKVERLESFRDQLLHSEWVQGQTHRTQTLLVSEKDLDGFLFLKILT